jgi:hypothetical protein
VNALLRVGGTTIGVLLGLVTGVWEAFLSPLYAGSFPLPVAPVLAVLVNFALVRCTHYVTGHRLLALLPGAAWFAVVLVCLDPTSEGDLVIPGNDWMGLLVLLLGASTWGLGGYLLILTPAVDRPAVTLSTGRAAPNAGDAALPAGDAATTASNAARRAGAARAPRAGARPARSGGRPAAGRRSGRSGGGRARS